MSANAIRRPRKAHDETLIAFRASSGFLIGAGYGESKLRRRRHVHLGAQRPDFADQVDHPVHLGYRLLVHLAVGLRPLGEAKKSFALRPRFAEHRPEFLGDEGHERMQQLQELVARPRRRRARFGLRRLVARRLKIGLAISRYQSQKTFQTKR